MNTSYANLRRAWTELMTQSGSLDALNRALVVNYLAGAAAHAARVLRTRSDEVQNANDAQQFATDVRAQDTLHRGFTLGNAVIGQSGSER
jgi:hypothetical protein